MKSERFKYLPFLVEHHAFAVALVLFSVFSIGGQDVSAKTAKRDLGKVKEELTLKNGDVLTGQLVSSTGKILKFKTDLEGEVTVEWGNVKRFKSERHFAVIPKDAKDSRDSTMVPQGVIGVGEKGIVVSQGRPVETVGEVNPPEAGQPISVLVESVDSSKALSTSKIGFIVDQTVYQKEIHRKIDWISGWEGHVDTGSTTIFSTQTSFLLSLQGTLKRSVPTVTWLDPRLRTLVDFNLSAGKATEDGEPDSYTNVYHVGAERDEYFSRKGYYLQTTSFDHDYGQGLVLQQIYGIGVGSTLLKTDKSEFDITADVHYEGQQFTSTADVSSLTLHLVGSSLTESYSHKWGKIQFDEKLSANAAWNNANAFSASGNGSMRTPIYKNLGYSVSVIDNFLNNPQSGYRKNSLQLSTGLAFTLDSRKD